MDRVLPYCRRSLTIRAPASRVWRTLTDPDLVARYMYGCRPQGSWRPGEPLEWVGADGVTYVRGRLLRLEEPSLLEYTTFDPSSGLEDKPENHTTVHCELTPDPEGTNLVVQQGDFTVVPQGPQRYMDAAKGWDTVLPAIKALAESST